jgi:flagellar motor switch protein FliM
VRSTPGSSNEAAVANSLDQSDVDALLAEANAAQAAPVEEPPARIFGRYPRQASPSEIKDYDFKRPERVSKDQMRALETLHEGFARNFGAALSGFLRTIVEVKVATCDQMTFSEFVSGLPNPTSFNLIEASTLDGHMCLEISPLIVYPIIDRLLGGNSQDLFVPQRPMTTIEQRLISNVMRRALAALQEAWSSVRAMQMTVVATESNPQLAQIVPPNEVVVVIGFEITMSSRSGTMNLCIPYNVIEPVMDLLSAQSWFSAARSQRSEESERRIAATLSRAATEVTVILADTTISVRDLVDMRPGDLIVTDKPATDPMVVCVEGRKLFLARAGQHRGQRAVRIERPIARGDRF